MGEKQEKSWKAKEFIHCISIFLTTVGMFGLLGSMSGVLNAKIHQKYNAFSHYVSLRQFQQTVVAVGTGNWIFVAL